MLKKPEYTPILVAALFPVIIVSLYLVFKVEPNYRTEALVVSGGMIFLGIILCILAAVLIHSSWAHNHDLHTSTVRTFLTQEWIDSQLVGLAQAYASASNRVIELQGVQNAEETLAEATERFKSTNQAFWAAHKLATDLGFEVDGTLESYAVRPMVVKLHKKPTNRAERNA